MEISVEDLELEAKALLKRAARIEADAAAQREQIRRFIDHLAESRRADTGREPARPTIGP